MYVIMCSKHCKSERPASSSKFQMHNNVFNPLQESISPSNVMCIIICFRYCKNTRTLSSSKIHMYYNLLHLLQEIKILIIFKCSRMLQTALTITTEKFLPHLQSGTCVTICSADCKSEKPAHHQRFTSATICSTYCKSERYVLISEFYVW